MLLSILVPLYNEEEFVTELLRRVLAAPLPAGIEREIVVVDDGSTDGSGEVVAAVAERYREVRLLRHERNQGKGACIRTALAAARGELCLVQDADLEYDPRDYPRLLQPLVDDRADAVYGSRFVVAGERRVLYFWHALANWVLTTFCNLAADLNLTDMETGYKAFRTSLARSLPLRQDRFGFEPEVTIKLAKRQARIEIPVTYHGRTYEEGKKIGFWDAVAAFAVILGCWWSSDIYHETGPGVLEAFTNAPRFNRWMADTVAPFVGTEVLEIGAGIGNLTRHLARRRRRYVATDLDAEHLARLKSRLHHRPNIEFRRCDLARAEDFTGLAAAVDTVICLNVLEHVADDGVGLRNIHDALKPGGRAVVLVPQGPAAFGRMDEALGHFRRYRQAELEERLRAAGFEVERILPFNRVSYPGWILHGKLLSRAAVGPFTLRLFDALTWLWRRIDGALPWPPASLIAVARKPAPEG